MLTVRLMSGISHTIPISAEGEGEGPIFREVETPWNVVALPLPPKKEPLWTVVAYKKGDNMWKEWPDFSQNDLFLAQLSSMTSLPSLSDIAANANVMCWRNTISLREKYFPQNDKPWPVSQQRIDKCCSSTTESAGNGLKPNWSDIICT